MILTTNILIDRLKDYGNPFGEIGRLVKEGALIPLVRGMYEDNPNASGLYLAGAIYGPSYHSFNTALSYHGLIPEAVYDFTSATCEKKKKRLIPTRLAYSPIGMFQQRFSRMASHFTRKMDTHS